MNKNIDFTEDIIKYFDKINYTPRKKQVENINKILDAYINKGFKYVVFSASTGVGKSLIALIVSEILHKYKKNKSIEHMKKSYIVAHTNTLLDQYKKSYDKLFDILLVKGKTNYICKTMNSTAEDCVYANLKSFPGINKQCENCLYLETIRNIDNKNHIITNYAYLFNSVFFSDKLARRLITVYDEGHLMNDIFVDFVKIKINTKTLDGYIKELKKEGNKKLIDVANIFDDIKYGLTHNEIKIDVYKHVLDDIKNACIDAIDEYQNLALNEKRERNYQMFSLYRKLSRKYETLLSKLNLFYVYDYEHVVDIVEIDKGEYELVISPIFMLDLFKKVEITDYFLFMSATIDEQYIKTTMNIDDSEIKFINGGSIFNKENKAIIDCKLSGFNYTKLKDKYFLNDVIDKIIKIVSEYSKEKGVILVTSFYQINEIKKRIDEYIKKNNLDIKMFYQNRDEGLKKVLLDFKKYENPSILLSPSLFEGISLDDDACRYIIFFKAPYYSLGDKRIKYISNKYPEIYTKLALYRMIQGSGRAVRNENDWCDIYFMDGNLAKLFDSEYNVWKNEFKRYYREF